MHNRALITFGDSWTYGVGTNYQPGMTKQEYESQAWSEHYCDKLSWRGLLAQRYQLEPVNFATPGSSNQKQFRLATEFFSSTQFKQLRQQCSRIIVLWGITATSRFEFFSNDFGGLKDVYLNNKDSTSKFFSTNFYNHEHEVLTLRNSIIHWEHFFDMLGVECSWFDTFNTHDYRIVKASDDKFFPAFADYQRVAGPDWPTYLDFCRGNFDGVPDSIAAEIFQLFKLNHDPQYPSKILGENQTSRDLLTWLCWVNNKHSSGDAYHQSVWQLDSDRIKYLLELGLVNPWSLHPTDRAHAMLVDYFSERIDFTI